MPIRHLIAPHPHSMLEKRSMFWLCKTSLSSTQMNTTSDRGLHRISNRSGRRVMDEWSMYQILYQRQLVDLNYQTIRLPINSSYQWSSVLPHSKPERLPTLAKALIHGGISPS